MTLSVRRPGNTPLTPANQQRVIGVDGFWGRHIGIDYPIVPIAEFGWDPVTSQWIPKLVAPDGSFIEYSAAAILSAVQRLCVDMANGVLSTDGVAAAISKLTESGAVARAAGLMPARQTTTEGQPVTDLATWQGMPITHDIAHIAFGANRKYVAVDAGAYTSPVGAAGPTDTTSTVTFTGVNLSGRAVLIFNASDRMYHTILTPITDPAGGAVGSMTVTPAIPSASAVLRIPYTDTPHAWNSAADAYQTLAVVGDPPRINGPATFISVNAALAANFQYILPCAMYGRYQVEIAWYTAGTTQVQFNIFGKYSDTAWAALGAIPPGYSQNTKFQTVAGVAFGAPPIGGGALATPNILCARMQDPDGFNTLAIEMNSINRDNNAVVVTGTYRLTGGTA
jgi:hypothetical protein